MPIQYSCHLFTWWRSRTGYSGCPYSTPAVYLQGGGAGQDISGCPYSTPTVYLQGSRAGQDISGYSTPVYLQGGGG